MSTEDIRKALRIYGHNADNMTNEMAENKLFEIVEGDPTGFISKWVNNKARDTQFIIEQATSKNVIRRKGRLFTYGTEKLGYGMEEVIHFIEEPKNQDIKIAILKAIDAKEYFDVVLPEETPDEIVTEIKEARKKVKTLETTKPKATKTKVTKENVEIEVNID